MASRSSRQRDYETKRDEYLAYGLHEYWIVDRLESKVTVLSRRGDAWDEATFRDDQAIVSLVLPGLSTKVAELWIGLEDDDDGEEGVAGRANGS